MAGPNFGTGSSREHAVWAITDYGFEAVISPRFGDIFRNNSTKNGLVPVLVPAEVGEALLRGIEADPTLEITIDVERRTLTAPALGIEVEFPLDDATRERFLEGLDDIGITLQSRRRHRRLRGQPPRLAADGLTDRPRGARPAPRHATGKGLTPGAGQKTGTDAGSPLGVNDCASTTVVPRASLTTSTSSTSASIRASPRRRWPADRAWSGRPAARTRAPSSATVTERAAVARPPR